MVIFLNSKRKTLKMSITYTYHRVSEILYVDFHDKSLVVL